MINHGKEAITYTIVTNITWAAPRRAHSTYQLSHISVELEFCYRVLYHSYSKSIIFLTVEIPLFMKHLTLHTGY